MAVGPRVALRSALLWLALVALGAADLTTTYADDGDVTSVAPEPARDLAAELEGGEQEGAEEANALKECWNYATDADIAAVRDAVDPHTLLPFYTMPFAAASKALVGFVAFGFFVQFAEQRGDAGSIISIVKNQVMRGGRNGFRLFLILVAANGVYRDVCEAIPIPVWTWPILIVTSPNYAAAAAAWSTIRLQSPAVLLGGVQHLEGKTFGVCISDFVFGSLDGVPLLQKIYSFLLWPYSVFYTPMAVVTFLFGPSQMFQIWHTFMELRRAGLDLGDGLVDDTNRALFYMLAMLLLASVVHEVSVYAYACLWLGLTGEQLVMVWQDERMLCETPCCSLGKVPILRGLVATLSTLGRPAAPIPTNDEVAYLRHLNPDIVGHRNVALQVELGNTREANPPEVVQLARLKVLIVSKSTLPLVTIMLHQVVVIAVVRWRVVEYHLNCPQPAEMIGIAHSLLETVNERHIGHYLASISNTTSPEFASRAVNMAWNL